MTTIFKKTITCSVCGNKSEHREISSTNTFGSMDLDTRPPEMMRSTMSFWIEECPNCAYVSSDLEKALSIEKAFLLSKEYLEFEKQRPQSDLAVQFIKKARISTKSGEYKTAFFDYLHAAWASDDENDDYWQNESRKCALQLYEQFGVDCDETLVVIKTDLLRKTRQFDRLIDEYSHMKFKDELLNQIIEFQLLKANQQDVETYTVDDVK